jgi:hypothetical protein
MFGSFSLATDVSQNCGLAELRFKLESEACWPWIGQTIAHLTVN